MLTWVINGFRFLGERLESTRGPFLSEEDGLEVVEWILVLGGVIVPLTFLIFQVMHLVARFYSFNSWVISLPFL